MYFVLSKDTMFVAKKEKGADSNTSVSLCFGSYSYLITS